MSDFWIITIISVSFVVFIIIYEYKKAMKDQKESYISHSEKCQELKKENLSPSEYKKRCLDILNDPDEYDKAIAASAQESEARRRSEKKYDIIVRKKCIENRKYAYEYEQCILEIFTPAISKEDDRRATCGYIEYSYIIDELCKKLNISKDNATTIFTEWYEHDMVKRRYNNPNLITLGSTLIFFGDIISTDDLTLDKWAVYNNLS